MLSFRRFRNTDLPAVVAIWRGRVLEEPSVTQVTPDVFDQLVLSKPYFEPDGLILALEDGQPLAFAHAGFGPNSDFSDISTERGVVCVVATRPDCDKMAVSTELIARCEAYLRGRGSTAIFGGAARPLAPYYVGLYGRSEPPGVLVEDQALVSAFEARGFVAVDETIQLSLDLRTYRSVMNPKMAKLRRVLTVDVDIDATPRNWWEACTLGSFELTRVSAQNRAGGGVISLATLRSMDPIFRGTAGRVLGLMDVRVAPEARRQGVATYLLNEAFRHASQQGVVRIEAQAPASDTCLRGLLQAIGMQEVSRGVILRKDGE